MPVNSCFDEIYEKQYKEIKILAEKEFRIKQVFEQPTLHVMTAGLYWLECLIMDKWIYAFMVYIIIWIWYIITDYLFHKNRQKTYKYQLNTMKIMHEGRVK